MLKKKNRLIVLEGSSGTGKTTIQFHLSHILKTRGYRVETVDEFSQSPLGEMLRTSRALQGSGYPEYLKNFAGAMTYLSDKIYSLECYLGKDADFIIIDRYFISQIVLGSLLIEDRVLKRKLSKMALETHYGFIKNFSESSRIFILNCDIEEVIRRLERREGVKLSAANALYVTQTAKLYANFSYDRLRWKTQFISSDGNIDNVTNEILTHLLIH